MSHIHFPSCYESLGLTYNLTWITLIFSQNHFKGKVLSLFSIGVYSPSYQEQSKENQLVNMANFYHETLILNLEPVNIYAYLDFI